MFLTSSKKKSRAVQYQGPHSLILTFIEKYAAEQAVS